MRHFSKTMPHSILSCTACFLFNILFCVFLLCLSLYIVIISFFQGVVLKPGSFSFKNWRNPPTPVYLQVRFFHVVNPDEIVKNGAKPQVEEKGPYTYRYNITITIILS